MEGVQLSSPQDYQVGNAYQHGPMTSQAGSNTAPLPNSPITSNPFVNTPPYAAGHGVSAGYGQPGQAGSGGPNNPERVDYKFSKTGETVDFQIHTTVEQPVEVKISAPPVSYDPATGFHPLFPTRGRPSSQGSPSTPPPAWQENKQYGHGDAVTAGNGQAYEARRPTVGEGPWSHTAPGSPYGGADPAWVQANGGSTSTAGPVWKETKPYKAGDIVIAGNGRAYTALRDTTGEGPWSAANGGYDKRYGPAWMESPSGSGSPAPSQDLKPPRPFEPDEFPPGKPSVVIQPPDPFVPGEFPGTFHGKAA